MQHAVKSIRPFIGAKNFAVSRAFYSDLGFRETVLSPALSVFAVGGFAFYLQNAYVQDWVDSTMLFLEVEDAAQYREEISALDLPGRYEGVRLSGIRDEEWGRECFLHDPSGILWHIGEFFDR
jgi:catechol 2,3-dioxygenase-like lactoylglutathione lyase family enzyme